MKQNQDKNAALEKADYTYDAKGQIIFVKRNTKFTN